MTTEPVTTCHDQPSSSLHSSASSLLKPSPENAHRRPHGPDTCRAEADEPVTNISLGLDALLGLLPVGGDVLTGFVQAGLVLVALKHYRVPRAVAARMMGNVLLDIAVGAIPLLGDMFDVFFKANTANLKLLAPYRRNRETPEVIL